MPLTPAKLAANRRNALSSTGPRTAAGLARSSLNAVRHGLRAEGVVVRGEDAETYAAVRHQLETEHAPGTAMEVVLVDQLAQLAWKLRRLAAAEAELFDQQFAVPLPGLTPQSAGQAMLKDIKSRNPISLRLQLYQMRVERALYRALTELRRLRAERSEMGGDDESNANTEVGIPAGERTIKIRPNEPTATAKTRPGRALRAAASTATTDGVGMAVGAAVVSRAGVHPVKSRACHGSTGRALLSDSSSASTGCAS